MNERWSLACQCGHFNRLDPNVPVRCNCGIGYCLESDEDEWRLSFENIPEGGLTLNLVLLEGG